MNERKRLLMLQYRLTPREADVALRLADGDAYKEAGAYLGISVNTVNAHVTEILRKTCLRTTRRLAALVRSLGEGSVPLESVPFEVALPARVHTTELA